MPPPRSGPGLGGCWTASVPEGDTIARAARALAEWLSGREITGARCVFSGFPVARVTGTTIETVHARGKHLLMRLSNGDVIHTHMRMTGSWHVYERDDRWRRPAHEARLVIEAGDRMAVCFNAPVVELLKPGGEHVHPGLAGLGPDILDPEFDVDEAVRRARAAPRSATLGEMLLDQRVVSGIGNIWRSEALFRAGVHPATPVGEVPEARLRAALTAAADLMTQSASPAGFRPRALVYKRTGRPCPRCRTPIASARIGEQARTAYWCPRCQPGPS